MLIDLKPQIVPLDLTGLQNFASAQNTRLVKLNQLINDADARIEKARRAAAPPPKGVTGPERQIIQTITDRQVNSEILTIRREADGALIEVLKAMKNAASTAKEMAERHFDLWSILRRAKTGNGVTGLLEATQLRAAYAQILAASGPTELAAWAQQAIDTADAILADAVLRENGVRKQDERAFMNSALLANLHNTEHVTAQALCNQVLDLNQQAGLAYSQFQRQDSAAFQRIQVGLTARQRIADAGSV